ncbi:unnamed protein product [Caenorhabditis auriculariae]|uniref:Uncharacterized protein n=1 Tax=Caenorhabditis auriculariae TaxID=2777116 RepID=A0A8S1GXR0_9PELO|nr:unnamed protein product [Caenorhabditis auriculariae]
MKALIGIFIPLFIPWTSASFCGTNGVPYSLEILSDGSPVLGCAQPTCMAEAPEDVEDSSFIANAAGQEDGFFREGDRQRKPFFRTNKPKADCPGTFSESACTKKNQWVGGIDFVDHPRDPLVLKCCSFEGLRFSQDVGVTTISTGEAVTGGEVIRDGRQISFDVIANVRHLIDPDDPKRAYYEVTVRRMNCLPDPPELEVHYDEEVESEVIRVLSNASNAAMQFGHDGHPHMDKEKKPFHNRTPFKRKPKTSSTHNVISPVHEDQEKKPKEAFIGSFGAPIYNPTANEIEEVPEESKATETTEITETTEVVTETPTTATSRHPIPYTRRILTIKPRIPKTTPAPSVRPPAHVQIEAETIAPVHVQPHDAHNPFSFAPLPPLPQFLMAPFAPPAAPAPPVPVPQQHPAFGVSQSAQIVPLPPPSPFGLFPQPPAQFGHYGVQNNAELDGLDGYTRSLLTDPGSPFMLQPQNTIASPPAPAQFVLPQQQFFLAPPPQQQPYQNAFNPFAQQQFPQLNRVMIPAPQRDPQLLGYDDQPEIVHPEMSPRQQQLGHIYRPPPFAALGTTIQNFNLHNRRQTA